MIRIDVKETEATRKRYNLIAPFYDVLEALTELLYKGWRRRAWSLIQGPQVLEVGVGTGKNIPHYPPQIAITGIDLSDGMLRRAHQKAASLEKSLSLHQMDAQSLDFPTNTFNSSVGTFVFCSVPDPVLGLKELARVVKPGGQIVLLEHVRSKIPFVGRLMDLLDPLVFRMMGPHINRKTVDNLQRAGLIIEKVEELDPFGIYKLIVAKVDGAV